MAKIKKAFYNWCIENNHQDWLSRWDYELNNDDPKNIGFRTHKEYYFKCENNKHKSESNMIDYITTRNCLQCKECKSDRNKSKVNNIIADGISYPEKFMYNLLHQLNIDFEYQYRPDWCKYQFKNKSHRGRYDFYIPSMKLIIEMDGGLGHGFNNTKVLTKEESKYIDNLKDKLAKEYNIQVIRIDCNYDLEDKFTYIKNNTINKLSIIFDLSKVNWNKIDLDSLSSFVLKACNLWNQGKHNPIDIAQELKLGRSTITEYLHKGNKLGLCLYNKSNNGLVYNPSNCKKVYCIELNKSYKSTSEAARETKICISCIKDCCHGKYSYAGKLPDGTPLHWIYYEDYLNQQKAS